VKVKVQSWARKKRPGLVERAQHRLDNVIVSCPAADCSCSAFPKLGGLAGKEARDIEARESHVRQSRQSPCSVRLTNLTNIILSYILCS
jgi:hypothetical protein